MQGYAKTRNWEMRNEKLETRKWKRKWGPLVIIDGAEFENHSDFHQNLHY